MKLGMFMHPIQDFKRGYHTLLLEDMEIIKYADELGFDEVWLGEHFALPSEPIQSPLMLYAALIPQTKNITFGAGVLCLPYQHPAIIAGQAAQFDHMSEGRFYMGIGPGATPPDFEMFKIGDLDRDGIDDVLIGAVGADDGGSGAGAGLLFLGGAGGI